MGFPFLIQQFIFTNLYRLKPPNGLRKRQRRFWRDSPEWLRDFWQAKPAKKRRSRCPLHAVLGSF
jgi:hypothetical protein